MALRAYEDIVGPLIIPARGKTYTLPTISLSDGVKLHAAINGGTLDAGELDRILLGDAKQQMVDDHVGGDVIDRALLAALTDFQQGRESAEEAWENGVPKAMREAAKELLTLMHNTDAEPTTKPPASTSGTTNPPAPRTRGKKSSPTGP
jgi:hypothetical protein